MYLGKAEAVHAWIFKPAQSQKVVHYRLLHHLPNPGLGKAMCVNTHCD